MTDIYVGLKTPSLTLPPISRTTLALYAGASGDHNPIHIDSDFAKKAGMPDVFAQGMLVMAYLGRMLTNWLPQTKLKKFTNRFVAITQLKDVISCHGQVIDIYQDNNEQLAKIKITAEQQDGTKLLVGEAIVLIE